MIYFLSNCNTSITVLLTAATRGTLHSHDLFIIIIFYLAVLCVMPDLSSLTRDWTWWLNHDSSSVEAWGLNHWTAKKSWHLFYNWKFVLFNPLHPFCPPSSVPLATTNLLSVSMSLVLFLIQHISEMIWNSSFSDSFYLV